jgi:thioredoxin 1
MKYLTVLLLGVSMSASAQNTILKFTARWCPPCQQMAPIVKAASEKTGVLVTEIDIDKEKDAPTKHNIRGIPTLILLKDGKEVERIVGVKSEDELVKIINETFSLTTTE